MTHGARACAAVLSVALLVSCGPEEADSALLDRSWAGYRETFITPAGRVVRPESGGDTVSEGQAYALLRAAWMDDQPTFDRVWRWTRDHLARTNRPFPHLLGWHWRADDGGRVEDWNVATDADADVALALFLAADRWPRPLGPGLPAYRDEAEAMLGELVEEAARPDAAGRLVFLPGAWADQRSEGRGLLLNPSYLAPASFRVFYQATGDARWRDLIDGAYEVLDALCMGEDKVRAVPDWVRWWSAQRWSPEGGATARSSWDAVRVPWRVATDWIWFREPRAQRYVTTCLEPFVRPHLATGMAVDRDVAGNAVEGVDDPLANAMYAFALTATRERDALLARVLAQLAYGDQGAVFFGGPDRYYRNSLAYLPFLARAGRYAAPRLDDR